MTHALKTWPVYFEQVRCGMKTFDIRPDDRTPRYEEGDLLDLREWDPALTRYTGRKITVSVTLVLRGAPIIPEGYCAMQVMITGDNRRKEHAMGSAKKWLCSKCNAELGIVTSEDRLRFGQTEGSLPVRATCECGHTQWLNRYEDCTGPDTEMPWPLIGK